MGVHAPTESVLSVTSGVIQQTVHVALLRGVQGTE